MTKSKANITINKRECGTCNLCCKLPSIKDFKPEYKWCKSCDVGVGCKIYEKRPKLCKDFYCLYQAGITDLKPNEKGFFIYLEKEESTLHRILTIMCEEHRLDQIPKLIMNDPDGFNLVHQGWAFHIRYNSNDNNIAIFDYKAFGMNLKKVKRNIPLEEQLHA